MRGHGRWLGGVALLLLGVGLGAQQLPAVTANTVEVSAQGQALADPDTAIVELEVSGSDATLAQAYAKAQAQADQLRTLLRQQGFTPQQARLGGYTVQPNMDYKTRRVTDYTVSAGLRLEVTDFNRVAPLVDAAGAAGFNALRGVSYTLRHADAAKSAAIADGYQETHAEATALARAAGRPLQGLLYATVDVSTPVEVAPMPRMMAMAAGAAAAPTEQFSPHQITVTARVSAVYRLEP